MPPQTWFAAGNFFRGHGRTYSIEIITHPQRPALVDGVNLAC